MALDPIALIYSAIDEVNAQFDDQPPIPKSPDTVLLGESGVDSLTLVNLTVAIEQQVQSKTGRSIVIIDESTFALAESPFETVGALAKYLKGLLN